MHVKCEEHPDTEEELKMCLPFSLPVPYFHPT